jgi:hypothetical protein
MLESCMLEGLRMEQGFEEPMDGEERPTLNKRGWGTRAEVSE